MAVSAVLSKSGSVAIRLKRPATKVKKNRAAKREFERWRGDAARLGGVDHPFELVEHVGVERSGHPGDAGVAASLRPDLDDHARLFRGLLEHMVAQPRVDGCGDVAVLRQQFCERAGPPLLVERAQAPPRSPPWRGSSGRGCRRSSRLPRRHGSWSPRGSRGGRRRARPLREFARAGCRPRCGGSERALSPTYRTTENEYSFSWRFEYGAIAAPRSGRIKNKPSRVQRRYRAAPIRRGGPRESRTGQGRVGPIPKWANGRTPGRADRP